MAEQYIKVQYSTESLWGDLDPDLEGYEETASADRYGEILKETLCEEYPGAEIDVYRSSRDRIICYDEGGYPSTNETGAIASIAREIWSRFEWTVEVEL